MNQKKIKNLIYFAVTIIAILALINVINHMLFLRWIDRYGKDIDAARYSGYLIPPLIAFHDEYHQWPGPPGPINDTFICELEGSSQAKINSHYINSYKEYNLEVMKKNKFGYYFYFELDERDPVGFRIENLSPDPKTGIPTEGGV